METIDSLLAKTVIKAMTLEEQLLPLRIYPGVDGPPSNCGGWIDCEKRWGPSLLFAGQIGGLTGHPLEPASFACSKPCGLLDLASGRPCNTQIAGLGFRAK